MSSYAYFVQTCREEHKKKHPDASVNFSEFSKKCSERWKVHGGCQKPLNLSISCKLSKFITVLQSWNAFFIIEYFLLQTMSPKEKSKFEDMAKQDKVRYEREMKNYIPPKGEKKKRFKDPNAPKRPPYVQFN